VCFGIGLSLGGMVRPSAVAGALSPAAFDGTLWALFMTALSVTFGLYRIASTVVRRAEAVATGKAVIDRRLMGGAMLFGVGWGLAGVCPGPLIVCLGADPLAPGLLLLMGSMGAGMVLASTLGSVGGGVAR